MRFSTDRPVPMGMVVFFGCTGHRGVFTDAVMSVKSG